MPPVNPQGSRGGLVAAVVTFTVLFVAATIFAIYYGVQDSKAEDTLATKQAQYRKIAQDLNTPDIASLQNLASSDTAIAEPTALAEAVHERDELRRIIVGDAPPPTDQGADSVAQSVAADAISKAQAAVAAANKTTGAGGAAMSASTLIDAVTNLTAQVQLLTQSVAQANAERDTARQQASKDEEAAQAAQATANKTVNDTKEQLQQQLDAAGDAIKKAQDEVAAAKNAFDDEQHSTSADLDAADKKNTALAAEIDNLKKEVGGLSDKLAGRRVDVIDPIVRRPEGQILDLGSDASTVYINLGSGDHIVSGMTFEVYDKTVPLPTLDAGPDGLPKGKASIEVTKVLPQGSECHVTRVDAGQTIVQGDPILNLIYSRNVKFNFVVYGDFDISQSGHPTPAGADVVKRLVVQWGGNLQRAINPETDFVVMGSPPELPNYGPDDLKDPLKAQELAAAQRASNDYETVEKQAEVLKIPILTQTKFFYLTGYYDLSQR